MKNLLTLDQYKLYKNLNKTQNDQRLQFIITSVSSMIKAYCYHSFVDFYETPKVQVFNLRFPKPTIQLNQWPIRQVQSVTIRRDYQSQHEQFTQFLVNKQLDLLVNRVQNFPQGIDSVIVTYTAGHQQAPQQIKIAAADLVHHYFKQQYRQRKSLLGATIDNSSGQYQGVQQLWPPHIVRVLNLHRNYSI